MKCDRFNCEKEANQFFQTIDNDGTPRFHKLCNECFKKMLNEDYDE
jgi:hypothetical protein